MTPKERVGSYKSGMGTCWKKEVKFTVLNGCHGLISTFKSLHYDDKNRTLNVFF